MDDQRHEQISGAGIRGDDVRRTAPPPSQAEERGRASHHFTDDFERTFLNGTAGNYCAEFTAADFRRWHANYISSGDTALGVVHRGGVPWYEALWWKIRRR